MSARRDPPSLTDRQEEILDMFFTTLWETGGTTSADLVARQLGITVPGVHKTISRLIRAGYLLRTRKKYRRFTLGQRGLAHYGITREALNARSGSQLRLELHPTRVKPTPEEKTQQLELTFLEAAS